MAAATSPLRRCCTSSASDFDSVVKQRFYVIGDSKSLETNSWPGTLETGLNTSTNPGTTWARDNISAGAQGAGYFAAQIDAMLATETANHVAILCNLGVNDFGTATEAQWIADMQYIADACHARWPSALFYVMRPWKQGFDATADTYAGWIATLVASRAFARSGPDERSWLKGADNGATNTTDGIHYSAAGETACAAQWKTTLGY